MMTTTMNANNVTAKKKKKNITTLRLSRDEKSKLWNIIYELQTKKNRRGRDGGRRDGVGEGEEQDGAHKEEDEDAEREREREREEETPPLTQTKICSECRGLTFSYDEGFPICIACGFIIKDILDFSPEWRYYGSSDDKNSKDPTRCGKPINPLLAESSIGCKILCNPNSSFEMKKIRRWTEWQSIPHREKSLYEEFQFITVMAQNAGIPKVFIDSAMSIHKNISEQKMFRGLNRDGMKSASIYMSCRLNGCPRTSHEIAEIFHLDKTSATNGCSMAVSILHNIERNMIPEAKTDLMTIRASSFVERYCSRLNINQELTNLSLFISGKIEENNIIFDNTPHSISAGIIYFISQNCRLNISKKQLKAVCGVSEVTINKCFKKMECMKEKFIPQCIMQKYHR